MAPSNKEKRKFSRMEFGAPCELFCEGQVWSSEVLDISFGGVMVRRPAAEALPYNKPFEVVIHVDDHETLALYLTVGTLRKNFTHLAVFTKSTLVEQAPPHCATT